MDKQKHMTHLYAAYERLTLDWKNTHTEREGLEKYIPCKQKQEQSWGGNTRVRQDGLQNRLKRDSEGHYMISEGPVQEEDMAIVTTYTPNAEALKIVQ